MWIFGLIWSGFLFVFWMSIFFGIVKLIFGGKG